MSRTRGSRFFEVLLVLLLGGPACLGQEISLDTGDVVPEFDGLDEHGDPWNSCKSVSGRMVVFFFYPSDFSFCCTRQVRRYGELHCEFVERGVEVIGISGDAVEAHRIFKDQNSLGFTLLSDKDGSIAQRFGVPMRRGGKAMVQDSSGKAVTDRDGKPITIPRDVTEARWTFIVGTDRRVLHRSTAVSAINDAREVLGIIDQLKSKSAD